MIITAWSGTPRTEAGDNSSSKTMPRFAAWGFRLARQERIKAGRSIGHRLGRRLGVGPQIGQLQHGLDCPRQHLAAGRDLLDHRDGAVRDRPAIAAQQQLGVGVDGRKGRLQLVGRAEHVLRPLFRGGHQTPIGGGQLRVAPPQGAGQAGRKIPHRAGNEHHRAEMPRQRRPAACRSDRASANSPARTRTAPRPRSPGGCRPGTSPWPKASPAGSGLCGKKMQARTMWNRYMNGAIGLQAAQVVDDHREHGQVQQDLQPQALHAPATRSRRPREAVRTMAR